MNTLRNWSLSANDPFCLPLAADARLSSTDYADDQVWQLDVGGVNEPALALHTRYGGRVGLASVVPMWQQDRRIIYETQAYAVPPVITQFAPGYLKAEGKLLPDVSLEALYWAMDSHVAGGAFTLENNGSNPVKLRLDLFSHVSDGGKDQRIGIITMQDGQNALHLGHIANLNPVVVLEGASADLTSGQTARPKVGVDFTIEPGKSKTLRWVHAGTPDIYDSLNLARFWLAEKWNNALEQIERGASSIPIIQTGDTAWDAVIASSYHQLVQAFLRPTGSMPYPSFVAARQPAYGFSRRGDGSDHSRAWDGQDPTTAYLIAPVIATIQPEWAKGIIQNYLAVQREDGWIDRQPGLAGQRQNLLCIPVLARMTWQLYEITRDEQFLKASFPGLLKFFARWFDEVHDKDQDGLPEWQQERQNGYVAFPAFAMGQQWSQGADIRYVETPDMAAYLISEAQSLLKMAVQMNSKSAQKQLAKSLEKLQGQLATMWQDGRYTYRDRDGHFRAESVQLLDKGRGDETHTLNAVLDPPNRLIVRIIGGVRHEPRVKLSISGTDSAGKATIEEVDTKAFVWQNGQGLYTTGRIFSRVESVRCEGLSRVYSISVDTVDLTRYDLNALMPIITDDLPPTQANALVKAITDQKQFLCSNGITMVPVSDVNYDPTSANGAGGVWPYWLTLLGEGLISYGDTRAVGDMLKNLLKTLTSILSEKHRFSEFYHSDNSLGLGTAGHLDGIMPLHLFSLAVGIRIPSSGRVWVHGHFAWGRSVSIRQHGVSVRRSSKGVKIKFPSGHTVEVDVKAGWQLIEDPKPVQAEAIVPLKSAPPSKKSSQPQQNTSKPVIIEVEIDE